MSDDSTRSHAGGASRPTTVALYTTHGELKTCLPEGGPEQDDRVSELFGRRVAFARSPGGPTYAAVKLAEGSRRPQTYYAAVRGVGTLDVGTVRREIDRLVESSEFRRTVPTPGDLADVSASLLDASPTDLSSTDESGRNVVDALSQGTPLRFETGDAGHALTLLETACAADHAGVVSVDTAVASDEGATVEGTGLAVGWHSGRSEVRPSDETERRLRRAAERRVERAVSAELDRIEEVVEALAEAGLDDREIRDRVTDQLPAAPSTDSASGTTAIPRSPTPRGPDGLGRVALPAAVFVLLGGVGAIAALLTRAGRFPSVPSLPSAPAVGAVDASVLPWVVGTVLLLFVALGGSIALHRHRRW